MPVVSLLGGPYAMQHNRVELNPAVIAVVECDCRLRGERPCGSATHWHHVGLDVLEDGTLAGSSVHGDLPRNAYYYVREAESARVARAQRGSTHAANPDRRLYLYAGQEAPSREELEAAGVIEVGEDA